MSSFLSVMLILSAVSNSNLDSGADGVPFLHLQGPCHHPKLPPLLDILPPSSYRKVEDSSIYEVSSPLLKSWAKDSYCGAGTVFYSLLN